MNQPTLATTPALKCPQCSGPAVPKTGPGRLCVYGGESGFLVPDDMALPTCTNGKCGTFWVDSQNHDRLTAEFERQREARRLDQVVSPAPTAGTERPQAVMPVAIPLADIIADYAWNARSGDYRTSDSDSEEGRGTVGLAESMEARGQDEPADVRPHPKLKDKFLLVDGFRREAAAQILDKRGSNIKGLPKGHLLCRILPLTEADARMLNIAKGTNRNNLKPADLAFGFYEALRLGKSIDEITKETGKHKSYVANLAKIANPRMFDGKLFDRWRKEGLSFTPDDIQLHIFQPNIPLEKQAEVMFAVLRSKPPPGKRHKSTTWSETARRQAKELGWNLGRLVFKGLLPPMVPNWEEAVVAVCVLGRHGRKSPVRQDAARPDQVAELGKVAETGYLQALEGQDSPWSSRREGYKAQHDKTRRSAAEEGLPSTDEDEDEDEGGEEPS